ncbi:hypothetical protein IKN40_06600, partial [bacterium]|nr:hypothetical protein [bacterium]
FGFTIHLVLLEFFIMRSKSACLFNILSNITFGLAHDDVDFAANFAHHLINQVTAGTAIADISHQIIQFSIFFSSSSSKAREVSQS